jgi:hypothetical protein
VMLLLSLPPWLMIKLTSHLQRRHAHSGDAP